MRGQLVKALRRHSQAAAAQAVRTVADPIQVALNNELKTRQRVTDLEARLALLELVVIDLRSRLDALEAKANKPLLLGLRSFLTWR
jgi:uncharacterized protein YceH (UPF0502 family)